MNSAFCQALHKHRHTLLWGIYGFHNSAARQVSPRAEAANTDTLPAGPNPSNTPWRDSLSPQNFVWARLDMRLQYRYKQGNDSKFDFPLEVQHSAVCCLMRRQWQVFIGFAWKSQFSWSSTHLTGRRKVSVVPHGSAEEFLIELMEMSFPWVVFLGWMQAWYGESGESWALSFFTTTFPPCMRWQGDVDEYGSSGCAELLELCQRNGNGK